MGVKKPMKREEWREKIIKYAQDAGTYHTFFEESINTLACILEKRDEAHEQFEQTGGNVVIKHTNKGGATNLMQNPLLRAVNDLNRDALTYWKELGLTPSSLRKLNENALEVKSENALIAVLKEMNG